MVQSWLMPDSVSDLRLENKTVPPIDVSMQQLRSLGISYYKLNGDDYDEELDVFRNERGYSYSDVCTINRELMPNYDDKIKNFAEEHIHTDDEVRFIVSGSGYFDVRNREDRWVRILVEKGDLVIIPAGIYHRFAVDTNDYIKAIRLFSGVPVWTPHNRPADGMEIRQKYLKQISTSG